MKIKLILVVAMNLAVYFGMAQNVEDLTLEDLMMHEPVKKTKN